jgi:hypothetical protein
MGTLVISHVRNSLGNCLLAVWVIKTWLCPAGTFWARDTFCATIEALVDSDEIIDFLGHRAIELSH